jgi:hypothetical protein
MIQRLTLSLAALGLTVVSLAAADKPAPDAEATRLLAEARAARASWSHFPGFTADVEVNSDGKVSRGSVVVSSEGKVKFEGLEKQAEIWAKHNLASTVSHRLDDNTPRDTPCAFADNVEQHPMGRAIRVLNDELHSGYRVRDKQITEVNRTMKDRRFTISVLENRPNAEGKFLSAAFVVNYWSLESGELLRTETNHQTWTRVGKFDLPVEALVLTATREKPGEGKPADSDAEPAARTLKLSNHKLLEASK